MTRHYLVPLCVLSFCLGAPAARSQSRSNDQWLAQAHAHNDYRHTRPLLDALDQGFCSVEADVFLVNGELLVAHDRDQVTPERTLTSLYLEPLAARFRKEAGAPAAPDCPYTLLIDVKSEAEPAWKALSAVLKKYRDVLTALSGTKSAEGRLQ